MKHFFERRDYWGNHSALWVLVGMAFILPMSLAALRSLEIDNDITGWLPQNDPQAMTFQWYQEVFPSDDQILVSWDHSSLGDPRIAEFKRRLSSQVDGNGLPDGQAPYVKNVLGPHDVIQRMKKGHVSEQDAIKQLTGVLIGEGSLKIQLESSATSSSETVQAALTRQVRKQLGLNVDVEEPHHFPQADNSPEADDDDDTERPLYDRKPFDFALHWTGMHEKTGRIDEVRDLASNLTLPDGSQPVAEVFQEAGDPIALGVVLSEAHH